MATTNFIDHLLTGDHASRPAFGSVPEGTLYSCTDHALIYQSDGVAAWSTYATLGTAGGAPSTADYLVGTANGSLSAEIVAGTSPGGELGGTWAAPTVDVVHAGATAPATYTPTLTAQTTNPTIGDGTLTGRWKMVDSKSLWLSISWTFGSTSAAGSGNYSFLLPNSVTSGALVQTLSGSLLDANLSTVHPVIGRVNASGTTVTRVYYVDGVAVDHNSPFVWAVGDVLTLTGIIEIA